MANNTSGQLKPLKTRLNAYQQGKRALKIEARRTVAEALGRGLNGVAYEVIRQRKVFRTHNTVQYVLLVVLFILLGYHVHIHGGLSHLF